MFVNGVPIGGERKRHRRTATEIQRHYKCQMPDCHKSYGSEGSLNQHMKLKHPEYYQQQVLCGNLQSGPGRVSAHASRLRMNYHASLNRGLGAVDDQREDQYEQQRGEANNDHINQDEEGRNLDDGGEQ